MIVLKSCPLKRRNEQQVFINRRDV